MSNQLYEERIRIFTFRSITERLLERHLITKEEFCAIMKKIDKMETDLVSAKQSSNRHGHQSAGIK